MSDWKNVQYKDGKMRTSNGGGGGGSSTFAGLDDVSFSNLQNGQVPKYNSTTQKWENANESGGGGTITDVTVDGTSVVNQQGIAEIPAIPDGLHHYSTTEQRIATWINGKPVYEIVLQVDTKTNAYATIDVSSLNIDIPLGADIFGRCTLYGTDFTLGSYFQDNNDGINTYLQSNKTTLVVRSRSNYPRGENMYVVLRYTKTTD